MKQLATALALILALNICLQAQRRIVRRAPETSNPAAQAQPAGQQLPIRRVILYSNGVAYFERRGPVTGHAEINLQFKQSQVDDVLKSMVVLDMGRGRIGAVSYNSSAPASARLGEIPFSIEAGTDGNTQGGLAGVLKQFQGARVVVSSANKTATGAILTVEESKSQVDANKPPVTTHTLVIASENGELTSFDLADVRSIKLVDEGAKRDLTQFADATASARRRDAKTIVVTSDGTGPREMVISYTLASPIWKTTYRVVMDSSGQPFFQGWAIVDNVSEEDWNGVQLSLISGKPISFIHPIQQPLYRYRPVVPIPDDLKLEPQTYEPGEGRESGGVGGGGAGGVSEMAVVTGADQEKMLRRKDQIQTRQIQELPQNGRNALNLAALAPGAAPASTLSDAIMSGESGVETAASGAEVGDLFEYRIDQPVTVRHDRSALIPILQTKLEGERVSIYNEAVRRDRPMSGMRLKNISALTLEDGSITVLDGDAYAGEALMERLKPGEKRLISFALDLGTLVTARRKEEREPVFMVRAVNGILQVHFYQTENKTYTITNQTDRPRTVYLEHPLRADWRLTDDTAKPVDRTANFYRFRLELEPNKTIELPIKERRALMESYAISNLTRNDIALFVSRRYINSQTRASLEKIIDLKNQLAAQDARLAAIDKEVEEISADQSRLRENIKALKDTAEARQLIARYVSKANEQETRIEQLTTERRTVSTERARLQTELDVAIGALKSE